MKTYIISFDNFLNEWIQFKSKTLSSARIDDLINAVRLAIRASEGSFSKFDYKKETNDTWKQMFFTIKQITKLSDDVIGEIFNECMRNGEDVIVKELIIATDKINEAVSFIGFHPKNKAKMHSKLRSIEQLNTEDIYLIAVRDKPGVMDNKFMPDKKLYWTDSWKFIDKKYSDKFEVDIYRFETNNGYSYQELEVDEHELLGMIKDGEIAKQK